MSASDMERILHGFLASDCNLGEGSPEKGMGCATLVEETEIDGGCFPRYVNEFWTPMQRQAGSIHEISYRACFKAQLPRFFIERLSGEGDVVYDPFSGRGTTVVEAGIMGRRIISNDVNPLSSILSRPRFFIPDLHEIESRLCGIRFDDAAPCDIDLSMFYHPQTLREIVSLKNYLQEKSREGTEDDVDRWIRMVATNRLTGHSPGFFSVYTLPPNQAISRERQLLINESRKQAPEYRDVRKIILRKSKSLLRNVSEGQRANLSKAGETALFLSRGARGTPEICEGSVQLTVTSPPFLDVVHYANDNWLRCWFNDLDAAGIESGITMAKTVAGWSKEMAAVFGELYRVTRQGGFVAFEVGEVRGGKVNLDECVIPLGIAAGFECLGVVVNSQQFTKTSNIWGVSNMSRGTNTNRIVVFKKER